MTPIDSRRKRTFEQFRDSQEDAVVQGREQPQPTQQPEQPEQPAGQAPAGIRGYLSRTLAWGKKMYNWATSKYVANVVIEMPEEGRIEEQNNKRRFVVPGAWPATPSPVRRLTPRQQTPRPIEPASPSPAPRPAPRPAAIEIQPVQEVAISLEITTAPVTEVTPVAAVEGSRPDPEAVVTEKKVTRERQPRRKQGRGEHQGSLTATLATISPEIPRMSRPEGKPVGILRKTLAARAMQQQLQQQQQQYQSRASRRVHFGEENQILQYCKPFPTKIKYYDIGGICGEAPSPFNRSTFQQIRSSDEFMPSPARSDISTPDKRPNLPATLSPTYKNQAVSEYVSITTTINAKKTRTSSENKMNTSNENKTRTSSENKTNTSNENKTNTSYENKTTTSNENKTSTSYENKTNTNSENKTNTSYENKTNTNSENKTNTSYENKTSSNENKTNTSYETKTNTSNEVKNKNHEHYDTDHEINEHNEHKTNTHEMNYVKHETKDQNTPGAHETDESNTIKSYIQMLKDQNKKEEELPSTPTTKRIDELVDQYELFGLSAKTRKFRQDKREAARKKAEEAAAAERKRVEEEAAAERKRIEEEKKRIEEERIKQEAEERKKRSIVTELTEEWKNKIKEAMATKNMQKDITPNLTRKDFGTLIPQSGTDGIGWLNDEIVNGYLTAIVAKALKKQGYKKGAEEIPKCHAFNTNLYNNYTKKGYKSVERWAQRAKIGGKRFLSVHNCLIPINNRSHWTLISISGTKRTIKYYDSLYNEPGEYTAFALAYVKDVLGEHFVAEEWTIIDASSAQQANGVDCGVFVCINALALAMEREPLTAFHARDAQAARQLIAATLLNGGLAGEFDVEMA